MLGRITGSQLLATGQANLAASRSQLARLQQQATTNTRLTKPSDDPTGTASALRVRAEQRANTQYGTNIGDGLGWLSTVDTAMSSAESIVRKASDLAVQGANTVTMNAAGREALATQLEGLRSDLLDTANTSYLGRSVFAGTSDAGKAFDGTTFGWNGAAGASVQRRISANETVPVDANGAAAFGSGATSVFASLTDLAAKIRAGDDTGVSAAITTLQGHLTSISTEHAVIGTRYARLEQAKDENATVALTLETQRSGIEDADAAKTLIDLKSQEVGYQTALAVTARVIQPTLMSFLS